MFSKGKTAMEWILAARLASWESPILRNKPKADNNNAKQTVSSRAILMRRGCRLISCGIGRLVASITLSTGSIVTPAYASAAQAGFPKPGIHWCRLVYR